MDQHLKQLQRLEQEVARLQRENARLNEKLTAALDGTGLCLWEQHVPSGQLTIFNMEWGKMLGFQPQELAATVNTWKSKIHPEDYDYVVGALEDHLAGKTECYQVVHRMLHKSGRHNWVTDRGRVVEYDSQGRPLRMMGTHIDITQEKRYEQQLAQLASSDPLTGTLNRHKFEFEFEQLNQQHKPLQSALVFIDIDNFKLVNDQFGHQCGDKVLIKVADWLSELAPPATHIGRMGGDEFVMLVSHINKRQLNDFTSALLARTEQLIQLEGAALQLGLSIGVCQFVTPCDDFSALYQLADNAMYQVKKQGKNGVAFVQANITMRPPRR
ncbi:diguanylate cyclase domain-containing protein [Shewanella sp.]|uniref:sensor domain-containing diguanylate cyclase n=1 Tax=Shewanella sp. TaxID=50422 RepID=UPI003A983C51